ncbi:hypothetical protein DPMN_103054 [Dreissena polymorpha]|uniref:Uncharacterized protein n=1 Tax=Dreissena polymorpha TaxID=45954 RepID=A0A9D4H7C9_DREPO|nr:hypothetical protein DPMN_103054 [Dreissena polymorpha]
MPVFTFSLKWKEYRICDFCALATDWFSVSDQMGTGLSEPDTFCNSSLTSWKTCEPHSGKRGLNACAIKCCHRHV